MKIGVIGKDVVEKAGPRLKWKQRVGADADNKQGRVKGRGERRKEERNSLEGKKKRRSNCWRNRGREGNGGE